MIEEIDGEADFYDEGVRDERERIIQLIDTELKDHLTVSCNPISVLKRLIGDINA